ncbi:MAG: TonB-dependent receptor plug domain-containing protein, partial [Sediminibacterium sp.]|nr:TonB-dependent receptor plug domain-containing protein [Sediminibacterium sp.]
MTKTDVEGRFSFSVDAGKKYSISLSYVGYKEKTIDDISVAKAGGEEFLNISLEEGGKALSGVTVTASARGSAKGETVNALIAFQKNTNTVASVISAEAIRRSPDKNTSEVLKRTPGASVQDGKFLIVRGLAERYNLAMLNGVQLGSTEPDRKAFSFDLIPSNMIDNIIINKAFVPELPGEWAGGLIQVNTRDIPSKNFFNIQIGTGVNTQTIGHDFYEYKGGKTDYLGIDDGTRSLAASYTTKSVFDALSNQQKTNIGKEFENTWGASATNGINRFNGQIQMSGGFTSGKGDKKFGGIFGLTYNRTAKYTKGTNSGFNFIGNGTFTPDFSFIDDKYSNDVLWGALGNISYQFDNNNKISAKTIFNINASDYTTLRTGLENNYNASLDSAKGYELGFKQNTFWNSQISGEHNLRPNVLKFKWHGSFTLLDSYIPDQRRLYYLKNNASINNPYTAVLSNVLSQKSGNRFYQNLSDYIYSGGADLAYTVDAFGSKQTIKVGYMLQVKDRLFDAKPFSIYLPRDNAAIRLQGPEAIFAPGNFGDGSVTSNLLAFDAIKGNLYRYIANSILNAGYVQFDNQFGSKFRVIWGARLEDYDQLVGSVVKTDPRHNYTRVRDILPGFNATYKVNNQTNVRLSASQTVVRPEFRELATFQYYDFELNAAVQGLPTIQRTKISNLDLRYELYPRSGEVITAGVFYKHFDKPIEMIYNFGQGGSSVFNFANPESADAYGVELEFRKKLDFSEALKNFTFQANGSYIYSRVKDANLLLDRPLQGQSPYLINVSLMYDLEQKGLTATLLYNQIGRRVTFVGSLDQPDIYESSRPVFDFQLTKKLAKNKAELRLNVQDILNKTLYFYQNPDGNANLNKATDPFRLSRQTGTTISVTFGYSL